MSYPQDPSAFQPPAQGQSQPSGYSSPGGYPQDYTQLHPAQQPGQQPMHQPIQAQGVTTFKVKQRLTMMVNRYEIVGVDPAGNEGPLWAFAEQKRMKLKEEVRFFTDSSKSQLAFTFKAQQVMDLGATYQVCDPSGAVLGQFKKQFAQSLLRSTWDLSSADGMQAQGSERNVAIAVLRRFWGFVPFVGEIPIPFLFHFDFRTSDGSLVMSSTKKMGLRDVYTVQLPHTNGWQLDWRVAAAMAVALDALQSR